MAETPGHEQLRPRPGLGDGDAVPQAVPQGDPLVTAIVNDQRRHGRRVAREAEVHEPNAVAPLQPILHRIGGDERELGARRARMVRDTLTPASIQRKSGMGRRGRAMTRVPPRALG